ncbi:hypothetical protein [Candidatus Nitrososphaera evergladensis]|uniref:hypothetical protein n=1 Tax=Candidatus Nitrososphaera evergladensis TaxID=1459637 RepID=UPI0011E5CACF|nr:hypothetical protein [Candidatus Nitrososphaera evergladensis]
MTTAIDELKALLHKGCKVQKVQPAVFASDAEVNIVIVTVACPDGRIHTVKAYREEAKELREFTRKQQTLQL